MRAESGRDVQALSNSFNARFNYLYPYTMKKALLILLTLLTLTNVMYSQLSQRTSYEYSIEDRDNLGVEVKSYTQTTYRSYSGGAESHAWTEHCHIESYKFDDKGKRLSWTTKYENGKKDSVTYTYDNKGNIIKRAEYDNGNLNSHEIYKYIYDNNGNKIEFVSHYWQGNLTDKTYKYIYDNNGNKIESVSYKNGNLTSHSHEIYKYIYDNNGNIMEGRKRKFLKEDTGLLLDDKELCKYDDKGNQIEVKRYLMGGDLWFWETFIYQYDQYGNWIKKTVSNKVNHGGFITTIWKIREYEYYPENSSINIENGVEEKIANNDVFVFCEQKNEKPVLDLKGRMYYYVVRENKFELYLGKTFSDAVAAGKWEGSSNFTIIENGIILEGRNRNVQYNFDEKGNLKGEKIMGVGMMFKKANEKFIPKREIKAPTVVGSDLRGGHFRLEQLNNAFVSVDDSGEPIGIYGQFMYLLIKNLDGNEACGTGKVLFFLGSSWQQALKNGIQKEGSLKEINEYKNFLSYSWNEEPNKIITLEWAGNGNFKSENCLSNCAIFKKLALTNKTLITVKNYVIPYSLE